MIFFFLKFKNISNIHVAIRRKNNQTNRFLNAFSGGIKEITDHWESAIIPSPADQCYTATSSLLS
jgi:hypothetical protein